MVDWTKPIQTRDGRNARFVCEISNSEKQSKVCVVTNIDGDEWVASWWPDGGFSMNPKPEDIMNAPDEPESLPRFEMFCKYRGFSPHWCEGDDAAELCLRMRRTLDEACAYMDEIRKRCLK